MDLHVFRFHVTLYNLNHPGIVWGIHMLNAWSVDKIENTGPRPDRLLNCGWMARVEDSIV